MKLNKNILKVVQSIVIIAAFFLAAKELYSIFVDIDVSLFNKYADKLTITNIVIIGLLGILSYIPLSFYDLITRKSIPIDLPVGEVYKYSWIASSISNLVGFGGSMAIVIKNYFYKDYVKDQPKLLKQNVKVVGLNLSGFSLICGIYSIWCLFTIKEYNMVFYMATLVGFYNIVVLCYSTYKLIKDKDKATYLDTLKIMSISILEWATTVLLIYGLIMILGIDVTLANFFPVYIKAIIVAIISMVPGGVGTFDLTMLVGLKKFNVQSEQILLLLLLYRISYYIVPAVVGIAVYIIHLYKKADEGARALISRINSKISTFLLITSVYVTGVFLILWITIDVEAIIKKSSVFNIDIINFSTYTSIVLGFLLIVLASMLNTKTKTIYYVLIGVFSIITVFSAVIINNFTTYVILIISWILILLSRERFYKKGFVFTWKNAIKSIGLVLILLVVALTHGSVFAVEVDLDITTINNFVYEVPPSYVEQLAIAIFLGAAIAISLIIILLNVNRFNKFPKETLDKERVMNLIQKYGGSSLAHYVFVDDKYVYINKTEDVFFQYQIIGDKIIILGNPVGNKSSFSTAIKEFYDLGDLYGYTLAFTGVDMSVFPELHDMGYEFLKIGQEAIVKLESFSLEGSKNKSKRQAASRIAKAGYTFSIETPPFKDELFKELEGVSIEWLDGKKEKGFCVGYFNREYIEMDKVAVVRDSEGQVKAFATIMPMYDNKTLSVDLMRFKNIELNGIMDFIFVNLFEYGKENGYEFFNLGLVPLADVGESKYSFIREKIAYQIFANGNFIYSFKGLKKFKDKYATEWEDRYLAYRKENSILIICVQLLTLLSREKN